MARQLPSLYKYTTREYAEAMLQRGVFRIGTIYEFRHVEEHGTEIGDDAEGTKQLFDDAKYSTWENASPIARQIIKGPHNFAFHDVTFELTIDSPDMFVYCLTESPSQQALSDFGADTCIEIFDIRRFVRALTGHLHRRQLVANKEGVRHCIYGERRRDWRTDDDVYPALLKDSRYEYQREVRVIWQPTNPPITPIVIECLPAAKYIRSLDLRLLP
jgi:hypothetical protein